MAYPLIGASCDCSTSWGLPRVLGLRKAMELALLGDSVEATEALRLGLVNRVVAKDSPVAEAEALVQRLAQGPTHALGHMKCRCAAPWSASWMPIWTRKPKALPSAGTPIFRKVSAPSARSARRGFKAAERTPIHERKPQASYEDTYYAIVGHPLPHHPGAACRVGTAELACAAPTPAAWRADGSTQPTPK